MKLKWDRLSILLAFVMGLMVLAAFFFGHVYFLAPIKQGADRAAQLVAEQTSLLADYPPEATLLEEYRQTYEETWEFLPEGERVDQELVIMEQLAAEENILVQVICRDWSKGSRAWNASGISILLGSKSLARSLSAVLSLLSCFTMWLVPKSRSNKKTIRTIT